MDNSEGMAEVIVFDEFVIIKDSLNCLSSLVVLLLLGRGQCVLDVSSLITTCGHSHYVLLSSSLAKRTILNWILVKMVTFLTCCS